MGFWGFGVLGLYFQPSLVGLPLVYSKQAHPAPQQVRVCPESAVVEVSSTPPAPPLHPPGPGTGRGRRPPCRRRCHPAGCQRWGLQVRQRGRIAIITVVIRIYVGSSCLTSAACLAPSTRKGQVTTLNVTGKKAYHHQ